jgi:hypothetical protein
MSGTSRVRAKPRNWRGLLAPVRNARKTAGKTTAVSAGLVVSRHEDYVVGDAGAVRFRKPGASLQGGYPPHAVLSHSSDEGHRGVVTGWTGSTGALVLGAIDFACRGLSWFQLVGIGR